MSQLSSSAAIEQKHIRRALAFALALLPMAGLAETKPAPAPPPAAPQPLPEASGFVDWFKSGKFSMNYRARYEHVDDAGFLNTAHALTLSTRTGFRTASLNNFSLYGDVESIYATGDYNSTANGRTQFPTIADPKGNEINSLYLAYGWNTPTQITIGRQRFILDNSRFWGNGGFRQNEQTYDAAIAQIARHGFTFRGGYLGEVHRSGGNYNPNPLLRQQDLDAWVFNLGYQFANDSALKGTNWVNYAYLVKNQDLPNTSNRVLGTRWISAVPISDTWKWTYGLEFATQQDYRGGSKDIDADYQLLETGFTDGIWALKIAQETLGGDGQYGFQTPFATLHMHNGWDDRFLVTPTRGLRDRFVDASRKWGPHMLQLQYHRFDADFGNVHYGNEWGLQYLFTINPNWAITAKYADYQADQLFKDNQKFWFTVEYKR